MKRKTGKRRTISPKRGRPFPRLPPEAAIGLAALAVLAAGLLFYALRSRGGGAAVETVSILGREYSVSAPWKGHFLGDELSSQRQDLASLPSRWGHGGASIYLTKGAADAFTGMAEVAGRQGIHFKVISGFRSYAYQRQAFETRLKKGQDFDSIAVWTAPPGYSRHMLGTAVDFFPNNASFMEIPTYRWLKENAAIFGFRETYPAGSPEGFRAEPWHWEWMGGGTVR